MTVNVFFASLLGRWLGGPLLSTAWSIALGCVIAVPATLAVARHIRRLMDAAETRDGAWHPTWRRRTTLFGLSEHG